MVFIYLALHDIACYAAAVYLIMHDHPYWAVAFMVLAATTTVRFHAAQQQPKQTRDTTPSMLSTVNTDRD